MMEESYAVNPSQCESTDLANRIERDNPTVAENIDRKIRYHQMEIVRLEAAKVQMAPLLNMKIGDMREVMSY